MHPPLKLLPRSSSPATRPSASTVTPYQDRRSSSVHQPLPFRQRCPFVASKKTTNCARSDGDGTDFRRDTGTTLFNAHEAQSGATRTTPLINVRPTSILHRRFWICPARRSAEQLVTELSFFFAPVEACPAYPEQNLISKPHETLCVHKQRLWNKYAGPQRPFTHPQNCPRERVFPDTQACSTLSGSSLWRTRYITVNRALFLESGTMLPTAYPECDHVFRWARYGTCFFPRIWPINRVARGINHQRCAGFAIQGRSNKDLPGSIVCKN